MMPIGYKKVNLNFLKTKLKPILSSLAVAVILLWVFFAGSATGKNNAQAEVVLNAATNAGQALKYFYSDQNRYPTGQEFGDKNIMDDYLSVFPLPNFPSSACAQSFKYTRVSLSSYQLQFCLVASIGNYQAGWNSVTGQLGN